MHLEWPNARRLEGDLVPGVQALKSSTDGNVTVLGSGSIVQQLLDADLVDELQLFVHPLVLGAGHTLFPRHDTLRRLELQIRRPHGDRRRVAHVPRGALTTTCSRTAIVPAGSASMTSCPQASSWSSQPASTARWCERSRLGSGGSVWRT